MHFSKLLVALLGVVFASVGMSSALGSVRAIGGASQVPDGRSLLWFPSPASQWTQALAIGNGRLGAMLFAGPELDRMQLNEITVWSGEPSPNADKSDGYKAVPEIRKLLSDGRYQEAQRLVASHLTANEQYFPSYQTLGDLTFSHRLPEGNIVDYSRWLDIDGAVAGLRFKIGDDIFTRETFASAPAGVIVVRLKCTRPGLINFDLRLTRPVSAKTIAVGDDTLLMTGNTDYDHHTGAVSYEAQARVITAGGTVRADGDHLKVNDADEATIYLSAGTTYLLDRSKGYIGIDPHERVTQKLAAASAQSFDILEKAHVADFQHFYNRVDFSVGNSKPATQPTDIRLHDFHKGDNDPALAELYYNFGRYLLICSSRPDNPLPSNSQGIWGDGLDLPWKCDYKSNINFQMNYWPAETANLSECHLPMIRLIESLVEPGRITAKSYFDAPGWVCAYTTNAYGWTTPGGGLPWGPFFGGSGWDCQHLWEHFAFTRDLAYLRTVYPTMKEACEFYLATLVPDANGMLVTSPSVSPENSFKTDQGVDACVCEGSAVEREIIWDIFTNTMQAEKVLKIDDQFRAKLEQARAKIRPLAIGKAGQLEEWGEDWDLNAPEKDHRHVSHLFALFPGKQITVSGTPELAAAVKKSLELRGDGGTGWSKAWKINLWARLHDGDHAYQLLCEQLQLATDGGTKYSHGGGTYANMFDAHPPFQIDGNFGGVSGINEMLLQSHETYLDPDAPDEEHYILELLPAVPSAWNSGHINGLRARGGFEVDQTWESHKLSHATIRSIAGHRCKVRYGGKTIDLKLDPGQTVQLDGSLTVQNIKEN